MMNQASTALSKVLPTRHGVSADTVFGLRADALVSAVVPVLVWLRHHEGWKLSKKRVAECFSLEGMVGLACIRKTSEEIREPLCAYLESLPHMDVRFEKKPDIANSDAPATWNRAFHRAGKVAFEQRDPVHGGRTLQRMSGWRLDEQTLVQHGYAAMHVIRLSLPDIIHAEISSSC